MVRCSNQDCHLGVCAWFHTACLGLSDNIPLDDEDWWCSLDCKNTGTSSMCTCKTVKDETVIICGNADCQMGIKFHLGCVKLTEAPGIMKHYQYYSFVTVVFLQRINYIIYLLLHCLTEKTRYFPKL